MSLVVGNLLATFDLNAKGFTAGMKQVDSATKSFSSKIAFSTAKIGSFAAALAAVGFSVMRFSKSIAAIEAIDRTMEAATGSAENAAKAWAFVEKESKRLGLSLEVTSSRYAKLSAAMMGTSIQGEELDKIFTAIAEKGAILGLTNERIALTFLAIEQMGSKSVVSMEELRRQLGENLPGALGIMARSLGVSLVTLNKWVSSGKLLAEDVLPLFADQLLMENEPAVRKLGESMQATISQVGTAWFDLKRAMADGFVNQALKTFNKLVAIAIDQVTALITVTNWLIALPRDKMAGYIKQHQDLANITAEATTVIEKSAEDIAASDAALVEKRTALFEKMSAVVSSTAEKEIDQWKGLKNQIEETLGEFSSFVADMALGIETSFSGMLKSMAHSLVQYTTQILVVKPIIEWLDSKLKSISAGPSGAGFLGQIVGSFLGGFKGFADGGIISEPVIGVGARSGSGYMFGEEGPEMVVPAASSGKLGAADNINITINALDSQSVTELLRNNPQAVTAPLVDALTVGDRGLSSAIRLSVT